VEYLTNSDDQQQFIKSQISTNILNFDRKKQRHLTRIRFPGRVRPKDFKSWY